MELPLIDCVTLTPVPESQRQIITNLIQLYKYDFSEFAEVGSPYGEVGPDGRFTYEGSIVTGKRTAGLRWRWKPTVGLRVSSW
jgi:hypothetical protein